MEPPILSDHRRITSYLEVAQLFIDNKDNRYMEAGRAPKFEVGWEDLALEIYLPQDNSIRTIIPSQVYPAFSERDWCGIISHIAKETSSSGVNIGIPANYRRYNVLVGGGRNHRIDVAKEIKAFEDDTSMERYTKGYIYSATNGTEYTPDEILLPKSIWFE